MPIQVLMPALSPTMEEGTLAKWVAKEGDVIEAGDVIAEIETDKATMEVEAVDEGTLAKILVPEGTDGVAVNAPIALILEEGEDESALDGFTPSAPSAPAPVAEAPQAAPAATPVPAVKGPDKGARIFASPLARRIAGQKGIDLSAIQGSGPKGRIIKRDVEGAGAMKPASAPAIIGDAYDAVPLTAMRKTIAKRLTEAKQTVPHFYLTIDCRIDELLKARKAVNEAQGLKLSVNDFIIKASALALKKVPAANASFTPEAILMHHHADIGVAVAIEGGLITPIVRHAETKGLGQISDEVKDMAARAKDKKLMPEEYQGGSFSISNLGMFGIKEFSAVINPPHGAILAVGAGEKRPVVLADDTLGVATVMTCTLSCDHRVVDGAVGAEFLAAFKGFIEQPLSMLV